MEFSIRLLPRIELRLYLLRPIPEPQNLNSNLKKFSYTDTPLMPAHSKLKQEDHNLEVKLDYKTSSSQLIQLRSYLSFVL